MTSKHLIKIYFLALIALFGRSVFAIDDPTKGKPFFPWVWEDQFKPTIVKGFDKTGFAIIGSSAVSVLAVHQYDGKVYDFSQNGGNLLMSESTASKFGQLGNGIFGLSVAATQFFFDQENGLKHARAVILTTTSHMTTAFLVQRRRPNNRSDFLPFPSSFPSGHTSSAFASAGSLAYAYGWKAGVPAHLVATAIALSRVKENRHWASDIVGGAFMGFFWARASAKADEPEEKQAFQVIPTPIYDGFMVSAIKDF